MNKVLTINYRCKGVNLKVLVGFILIILSQMVYADDPIDSDTWKEIFLQSQFSGVVLVAKDHEILFKEAFGLANREKNIPFTQNSIFDIGSLTKQFTATAILKLQESNKLSVNDSLSEFFDNVPDDKQPITIHQLLTHTAGFIATKGGGSSNLYDVVSQQELIEAAFKTKLLSMPGEEYHYSNIGYNLLAIIIEKVTGDSYETYYQESLFKPAGLTQTGYRLPKRTTNNVVINYGADQTTLQKFFSIEPESQPVGSPFQHLDLKEGPRFNMEGAGGMSSTVDDLFRWYLALNSNLILSSKSKQLLFAPHNASLKIKSESHYGYGWDIKLTDTETLHAQHNGSNGYSFADMHYFVDDNIFIVLATNDIDVYSQSMMDNLLLLLTSTLAVHTDIE